MKASRILTIGLVLGIGFTFAPINRGQDKRPDDKKPEPKKPEEKKPEENKPVDLAKDVPAVREKGLDWLTKNQVADGTWAKPYTIGVTAMGCLAYLSASDEPFKGDRGKALVKALQFLLDNQKDGKFPTQGKALVTWIHGQGFATLALAEAYGRSLFCKDKPDIDLKKVRDVIAQSVKEIAKAQANSGGWWYTPSQNQDEGSTTVFAVQALVSAQNYGIDIDKKVLDRGFEYLKKCQNKDGSFHYQLGDGQSMKGGTAAGVATLGLMEKYDFTVMINGYNYLLKFTPAGMSAKHGPHYFPYYGHYFGTMGMYLLGQEYKDDKQFRTNTARYIADTQKELVTTQNKDGGWPDKTWQGQQEYPGDAYAVAFATMALFVPESRLSVYKRVQPKLPKE